MHRPAEGSGAAASSTGTGPPGSARSEYRVFPTPDPAPLQWSAAYGLWPVSEAPAHHFRRSPALSSCVAHSHLGAPRELCPTPSFDLPLQSRRRGRSPSRCLRIRTVTPETLLLPFPGPAPAPAPSPRGGSSARRGSAPVPASPPLPRTAIPSGSGEQSDRESGLNKELVSSDWL